jgi:hypothetical protein
VDHARVLHGGLGDVLGGQAPVGGRVELRLREARLVVVEVVVVV